MNTTLFIMFGLVVYNTPLNDILALNVKDVNNLYFPDTYPYIDIPKTATPSAVTSSSGGLSKGAIAGIAVGCVIAVSYFFQKSYMMIVLTIYTN